MNRLLALCLCLAVATPAGAVSIADLHQNDANGVPLLLGQTVTVSGVVTAPTGLFSGYNLEVYVQDATGGVLVWVSGAASQFNLALGDSVTVTSHVAQYNGMTEVGTSTAYTTIVNHGPAAGGVPEPLPLTCAQLNAAFHPDDSEPDEGRLVRLTGVSIVSGAWPTTPGGNTVLYVSDGTGTAKVYIDQDTPLNGSPEPPDGFTLVGLLKQYDSSSPYTTGYELLPRDLGDVIPPDSGPGIPAPADVRNVTATAADILFDTTLPGSSEVEYGPDTGYGLTAGDSTASETSHAVHLDGLAPNTLYHFRAVSRDAGGVSYGPDQVLVTASDVPGEFHVYFSGSGDPGVTGCFTDMQWQQILSAKLAILINQAQSTIDCAFYSFSLNNVRDALLAAHNRGVQVRLIIDAGSSTYDADVLAAAGVPYITSTFGGNHASGIMHNKFVVIDARDGDPANDWVWTGSANMSVSGNDDMNNALAVRDFGLAQAYTLEFDEMWGSDTMTPDAAAAAMGDAKSDNTPHEFTINGMRVEQYMSPSDGVTDRIIAAIGTAEQSLAFAVLAFTHDDIAAALHQRFQAGIPVLGVFDQDQGDCTSGSEYFSLHGDPCAAAPWNPPADVWLDTALSPDVLLHHKYLVVDGRLTTCDAMAHIPNPYDPLVVTGSHNWSYSAETVNDENTLIIHDDAVAAAYLAEFSERYHEAGGSGGVGIVTAAGDAPPAAAAAELRAWPNPFNPSTRITLRTRTSGRCRVAVYDARGRRVRRLLDDPLLPAGLHVLGWDGRDDAGRTAAGGLYLVRAVLVTEAGARTTARARITLLK